MVHALAEARRGFGALPIGLHPGVVGRIAFGTQTLVLLPQPHQGLGRGGRRGEGGDGSDTANSGDHLPPGRGDGTTCAIDRNSHDPGFHRARVAVRPSAGAGNIAGGRSCIGLNYNVVLLPVVVKSFVVNIMTEKLSPVSFRLPAVKKAALEKAAADDTRSVSSMIEKVLTDWLKANGYLKK